VLTSSSVSPPAGSSYIRAPAFGVPVSGLDLALEGGLDVGNLLRRQPLVEVQHPLDEGDHAGAAGAVGRVGDVDGVDGGEFVRSLSRKPPDPMTDWLNGHKRACQFFVRIRC